MGSSLPRADPAELAASAAAFAAGGGAILLDLFGRNLRTDYKGKEKTDPVSEADRASQAYLARAASERYPEHGILGEEKPEEKAKARLEGTLPVPDYLWVIDPLDGTKNYLNGLAIWACSVAVLFRGRPVAGAIFTPEGSGKGAGTVYRAWEGGGAFQGDLPIRVEKEEKPTARRIASLPGTYWTQFRPTGPLRAGVGEVRAPGSIAYELALVARGGLHYALFGGPGIWDVAAGLLLVREAGGLPLLRHEGTNRWAPFDSFYSDEATPKTLETSREWRRSLLVGNPALCRFLAAHLRKVNRPRLWTRRNPPGS